MKPQQSAEEHLRELLGANGMIVRWEGGRIAIHNIPCQHDLTVVRGRDLAEAISEMLNCFGHHMDEELRAACLEFIRSEQEAREVG